MIDKVKLCCYLFALLAFHTTETHGTEEGALRKLIDSDWDVSLLNVTAKFDDSGSPEVTVTYNGPEPLGTQEEKYYRQRVLNPPDCDRYATSKAIVPVEEYIPMEQYENGVMTTFVDIDTTLVQDSVYWTQNNETDASFGAIQFCLQTETYNEGHFATGTELSIITINVNMSTSFEITPTLAEVEVRKVNEDANVNVLLSAFYCNLENQPITPDPFQPSQNLRVCVSPESEGFDIVDLRSVKFTNIFAFDYELAIIDEEAIETNNQTLKECIDGSCYVQTLIFAQLFRVDNDFDGIPDDLSDGYMFEGTAVVDFISYRRRRLGLKYQESEVRKLEEPTNHDKDFGLPFQVNASAFTNVEVASSTVSHRLTTTAFSVAAIVSMLLGL